MKHDGLCGSDLIHCWLERRIHPLQHHGDRLMHQITSDKKDKMRVSSSRIPVKDYKTLMYFLIKERVERKIPEVSMKMYTTNRPLTPASVSDYTFVFRRSFSVIPLTLFSSMLF